MLKGGRWNSPGKRVIYAAETFAGAVLEVLVHANLGFIPLTQSVVRINIPEMIAVERIDAGTVPDWEAEDVVASRRFGDRWIEERRTAVLLVPSVILRGRESNVVFNPEHPEFAGIKASEPEPVAWDPRLFSRPR